MGVHSKKYEKNNVFFTKKGFFVEKYSKKMYFNEILIEKRLAQIICLKPVYLSAVRQTLPNL